MLCKHAVRKRRARLGKPRNSLANVSPASPVKFMKAAGGKYQLLCFCLTSIRSCLERRRNTQAAFQKCSQMCFQIYTELMRLMNKWFLLTSSVITIIIIMTLYYSQQMKIFCLLSNIICCSFVASVLFSLCSRSVALNGWACRNRWILIGCQHFFLSASWYITAIFVYINVYNKSQ